MDRAHAQRRRLRRARPGFVSGIPSRAASSRRRHSGYGASATEKGRWTIDIPRFDFHVHTEHLGCANETMKVRSIVERCASLGLAKLGIADHLNTLEQLALHRRIREDIKAIKAIDIDADIEVYFGVELNFLEADGEFAYGEEVRDELGFQFAIGGIHGTYLQEYDIDRLVAIQHRHHLRTCEDPLVGVLVHPYWFGKGEFDTKGFPWFDSMKVVPESMTRELGAAARETGTAVEINACANLVNGRFSEGYVAEYVEYLAILESEGVTFAAGSDAHDINSLQKIGSVRAVMERLGLSEDRVWRPAGRPLVGGGEA